MKDNADMTLSLRDMLKEREAESECIKAIKEGLLLLEQNLGYFAFLIKQDQGVFSHHSNRKISSFSADIKIQLYKLKEMMKEQLAMLTNIFLEKVTGD